MVSFRGAAPELVRFFKKSTNVSFWPRILLESGARIFYDFVRTSLPGLPHPRRPFQSNATAETKQLVELDDVTAHVLALGIVEDIKYAIDVLQADLLDDQAVQIVLAVQVQLATLGKSLKGFTSP